MKRQTAIWLYGFLFLLQIVGLCVGLLRLVSDLSRGSQESLIPSLVGGAVGCGLAAIWFRELKRRSAASDQQ